MLKHARNCHYPLNGSDNCLHDAYYTLYYFDVEGFGNYYPPVLSWAKTSCFDYPTQGSDSDALSCDGGAFGSDFEVFGFDFPLYFSD